MGGCCLYCDGVIFGLIDDDRVYFKGDAKATPQYLAAGLEPFRPFKDEPEKVMQYYAAPEEAIENAQELLRWARVGLEAGLRSKKKPAGRVKASGKATKKKLSPSKKKAKKRNRK